MHSARIWTLVYLLFFWAYFKEKCSKEQKCHDIFTPIYSSPDSSFFILTSSFLRHALKYPGTCRQGAGSLSPLEAVLCYWPSLAAGPLGTSAPLAPQEDIEQGGVSWVQLPSPWRPGSLYVRPPDSALGMGLESSPSPELQIA